MNWKFLDSLANILYVSKNLHISAHVTKKSIGIFLLPWDFSQHRIYIHLQPDLRRSSKNPTLAHRRVSELGLLCNKLRRVGEEISLFK